MTNLNWESIRNGVFDFFKKLALYLALLFFGAAATAFYFDNQVEVKPIKVYEAGELNISINERSELMFLDLKTGEPFKMDSVITAIINNKLAGEEYLKVNIDRGLAKK